MIQNLLETFSTVFGPGDLPRIFKTGGRVNIIGEHTDYNGGHVFPCALTMGTWCILRRRNDSVVRYYSLNFPEDGILTGDVNIIEKRSPSKWCDYCTAMIWAFKEEGEILISGYDLLVYGNIPNGSGLSSSASLEVCFGYAIKECFDLKADKLKLALLGQKAENGFIGVSCGIMDQYAVAMGKLGQAMYLDTSSLECKYVPLELGECGLLIMDTKKKRSLAGSKYNERRGECERALKALQSKLDVKTLGDLDSKTFEDNAFLIANTIERKRAKHAVYENERTKEAITAMENNDLIALGRLLNESHASLRDDYEVSCRELDILVSEAQKMEGVYGARMTGAGFGGCAVALVKKSCIPLVSQKVGEVYKKETGLTAAFYPAEVGGGPEEITL